MYFTFPSVIHCSRSQGPHHEEPEQPSRVVHDMRNTVLQTQAFIQLFKYVSKTPMEADRLAVSHMEATSVQADISTQLHLCKVLSQNHPARPFPKFPLTGTMRSLVTFKLLNLKSICKQQEPTNVVPKISLLLYCQLWPGALSYHTEFASRSLILGKFISVCLSTLILCPPLQSFKAQLKTHLLIQQN